MSVAKDSRIRLIETDKVGGTDGTWAQVTRKGSLVFISGQVGLDKAGTVVGGFEAQARQCLDNLVDVLEAAGGSLKDLMQIAVFVKDMGQRPIFARSAMPTSARIRRRARSSRSSASSWTTCCSK